MKFSFIFVTLIMVCFTAWAKDPAYANPLTKYSKEWNNPKYNVCNTAAGARYLNDTEKQVIYILNLARMNPKLFSKTVLPHANEISFHNDTSDEEYFKTLVMLMDTMRPAAILYPDSLCYLSARCHVETTGPAGIVTHDRQTPECNELRHKHGENCAYGHYDPLGMIVALLIDRYTSSLGHREACLRNYSYNGIGVAMGPHNTYNIMAVMDFW